MTTSVKNFLSRTLKVILSAFIFCVVFTGISPDDLLGFGPKVNALDEIYTLNVNFVEQPVEYAFKVDGIPQESVSQSDIDAGKTVTLTIVPTEGFILEYLNNNYFDVSGLDNNYLDFTCTNADNYGTEYHI